jgi:hypothetical protein
MVAPRLFILRFTEATILIKRTPLSSLSNRNNLNTRRAGMTNEMAVSQFLFRNLILPGAKMNFNRKSMIKMIQMVTLRSSKKGDKPQISSITSNTNHIKPRKTIGPSSSRSTVLSSFFLSLSVLLSIAEILLQRVDERRPTL